MITVENNLSVSGYNTVRLWTHKEIKNFLKTKEPMFYEDDMEILVQRQKKDKYISHKRALKKQAKLALDCEPIQGGLKSQVDNIVDLFRNIKDYISKFNYYNFNQCLQAGLDEYMGQRQCSGQYVVKNLKNKNEYGLIQQSDKSNFFKFIVYNSNNEPQRWYYVINDYLAKNFDPRKKFVFHQSLYANKDEIAKITPEMIGDLKWLKAGLEKSFEFFKNNHISRIILKK